MRPLARHAANKGYGRPTDPGVAVKRSLERGEPFLSITATELASYCDRPDEAIRLLREAGGKSGE